TQKEQNLQGFRADIAEIAEGHPQRRKLFRLEHTVAIDRGIALNAGRGVETDQMSAHGPRHHAADVRQDLVRQYRMTFSSERVEYCLEVHARDVGQLLVTDLRQDVMAPQIVALLPGLVLRLRNLLEITVADRPEVLASFCRQPLCNFLTLRILPQRDTGLDAPSGFTGLLKANPVAAANVVPAGLAGVPIDCLEALVS